MKCVLLIDLDTERTPAIAISVEQLPDPVRDFGVLIEAAAAIAKVLISEGMEKQEVIENFTKHLSAAIDDGWAMMENCDLH